jgi:hypothetical protein
LSEISDRLVDADERYLPPDDGHLEHLVRPKDLRIIR